VSHSERRATLGHEVIRDLRNPDGVDLNLRQIVPHSAFNIEERKYDSPTTQSRSTNDRIGFDTAVD
jgi:hypothetical protein